MAHQFFLTCGWLWEIVLSILQVLWLRWCAKGQLCMNQSPQVKEKAECQALWSLYTRTKSYSSTEHTWVHITSRLQLSEEVLWAVLSIRLSYNGSWNPSPLILNSVISSFSHIKGFIYHINMWITASKLLPCGILTWASKSYTKSNSSKHRQYNKWHNRNLLFVSFSWVCAHMSVLLKTVSVAPYTHKRNASCCISVAQHFSECLARTHY